ncbi:MAG TPA: hypothetical protein VMV19_08275 [Xanthobacteraceae bacterium]|nr:hypothetical protein [Xanthobacteraceae bacterium]
MSNSEIVFLAFVLGSFAYFMVVLAWAQYVTRDVDQNRAISPAINPQTESPSGLQTFKKAA